MVFYMKILLLFYIKTETCFISPILLVILKLFLFKFVRYLKIWIILVNFAKLMGFYFKFKILLAIFYCEKLRVYFNKVFKIFQKVVVR